MFTLLVCYSPFLMTLNKPRPGDALCLKDSGNISGETNTKYQITNNNKYLNIYLMFVRISSNPAIREKNILCKWIYNHSASSPILKQDFRYIVVLMFFEYIDLLYWCSCLGGLKSFKEEKPVLLQYCKVFCWRSKQLPLIIPKTN